MSDLLIRPSEAIQMLPALLSLSPEVFDAGSWIKTALKEGNDLSRPIPVLRYYEHWSPRVSKKKAKKILLKLIRKDPEVAAAAFALYFDKVMEHWSQSENLMEKVQDLIITSRTHPAVAAFYPLDAMPSRLKSSVTKWISTREKPWITDLVQPVQHSTWTPGCCEKMQFHRDTLLSPEERFYGRAILISVQGRVIGSMKLRETGDPSMVGLRNIRDSLGRYPILGGGIYALPREVVLWAEVSAQGDGEFDRFDLDELRVKPLVFLDHERTAKDARETARSLMRARKVHEASLTQSRSPTPGPRLNLDRDDPLALRSRTGYRNGNLPGG